MKKKYLSLLLASLIICTSAVSCKNQDNTDDESTPPVSDEATDNGSENIADESSDTSNAESSDESTENTDASQEADNSENDENTEPVQSSDNFVYEAPEGFEIITTLNRSQYSVFSTETENGIRQGIVDITGKVVAEPEYTTLGYCPWHEVIYAEPFAEGDEPVIIDEKYKIDLHYGHGGSGYSYLIYSQDAGKMFECYFDMDCIEVDELQNFKALTPYICYSGETEITAGSYYMGDGTGIYEMLDEIVYGASGAECEFISDIGSIVSLGKLDFIPNTGFINDYMVICRDGKYGLVNGIGKECTQIIYEAAQTAFDGRAWVKHEGIWKIAELA